MDEAGGRGYTDNDGYEKNLEYETAAEGSLINCLKTDGVWSADKNNLCLKRTIALKNFRRLFGPQGIACRNAKLGLSLKWTSSDSRQRGAESIMAFSVTKEDLFEAKDHTFVEGEEVVFGQQRLQVIATPGHTPGGICF